MSTLGMDKVYIASDYEDVQGDVLQKVGTFLDGRLSYVENGLGDTPDAKAKLDAFTAEYNKMYNAQPESYVDLLYDCFGVLINSMKSGVVSGDQLRASLASTKDFIGIGGNVTFDNWGRTAGSLAIYDYANKTATVDPFTVK